MKSKLAYYVVVIAYLFIRIITLDFHDLNNNKFTDSDGLGYYMYLPGVFIYQDIKKYEWLPEIEKKYNVYGEEKAFQIGLLDNGNYVTNYLSGVAVLQLPFFVIGHAIALMTDHPADGFSPPYQLSIASAPLFYFFLFLCILRWILLKYFDDHVVGISIVLMFLASNAVEYIAIEAGQSHGYVLPLYIAVLYLTIKWHEKPSLLTSWSIGICIGLATIMRPTELIMILIPLLWNTQTKQEKTKKWQLVKSNKPLIYWAIVGGIMGGIIQVVYWLYVTGNFIYPVGSKWRFLDPYWRVLIGWEKGWFIYTPVTLLFFIGLFYLKNMPFKKAVLWFCFINLWIIISWDNWRYGGSYSTRALVQSYPVFAFALCTMTEKIFSSRWKPVYYLLGFYLIAVNLFQIWQYRQNILHYDHNNKAYYQAIYLDLNPTPIDMSLLDGGLNIELINCDQFISKKEDKKVNSKSSIIDINHKDLDKPYIKLKLDLFIKKGYWDGKIKLEFVSNNKIVDKKSFRTFHAMSLFQKYNTYEMIVKSPISWNKLQIGLEEISEAHIKNMSITQCDN